MGTLHPKYALKVCSRLQSKYLPLKVAFLKVHVVIAMGTFRGSERAVPVRKHTINNATLVAYMAELTQTL